MTITIPEQFGPVYPGLNASVQKFRRKAHRGLHTLSREERRAYGEAVGEAIRALQRSSLMREVASFAPGCASGTWHTTGEAIIKAVRAQQRAALLAYPSKERRERTDVQWRYLYAEAMRTKQRHEEQRAA